MLILMNARILSAQRVMYSPTIEDRSMLQWEMAGKAGDYYWVEITRNVQRRDPDQGMSMDRRKKAATRTVEEQNFEIYDGRMNQVNVTFSQAIMPNLLKEYLVTDDLYFDQLSLTAGSSPTGHGITNIFLQRYEASGRPVDNGKVIGQFPFSESGNSFLLVRSEDRSKILLLGFESVRNSSMHLHAFLFDQDWRPYYHRIFQHPWITQPFIQDEFTGYPLEDFDKGPIKLANNGQWLMAAPSRTNRNYLLFHFCGSDSSFSCHEIRLPTSSSMEDVDVAINNQNAEAYTGILSNFRFAALKNVQVVHYSLNTGEIDFDSSYRFNTLVSGKVKDGNQVKENFIAVPGKGFMLMKEYGRAYTDWYEEDDYDNQWDPEWLFAGNPPPDKGIPSPVIRDGYARYSTLGGLGKAHERGDLGLFYFPGGKKDSCWSAMISQEQVTEMNAPNLSYLAIPVSDKLFFLYNTLFRNDDLFASTTIIDHQGNKISSEGIVFWKVRHTLQFQQSRQISENEVVVPYENNRRKGFAVVKF
ncbi:hypothetical protein ACX0G9_00170 [Flavitalea flava]